jgi:hypothetical protein
MRSSVDLAIAIVLLCKVLVQTASVIELKNGTQQVGGIIFSFPGKEGQ